MIRTPFVLVHGAWHGAWCFDLLVEALAARGYPAVAVDLPAHGLMGPWASPGSGLRPTVGRSSDASLVTLDDYVVRVIEAIDRVRNGFGVDEVALVGHSLGGMTITAVAERRPDMLKALVYLAAFIPANGSSAAEMNQIPEAQASRLSDLIIDDPTKMGAARIDPLSEDPDYVAKLRQVFFGDVDAGQVDVVRRMLVADEPVVPAATPIPKTAERWGSIPRHYVICADDMAMRPKHSEAMIRIADAEAPHNPTKVTTLAASHSPFLSMPDALAEVLVAAVTG